MNLCRLCASDLETTPDELINIRDDQSNEICRKVELCCNVFIELTDNTLPTVACKQCMKLLNICYDFHEKVNKAQTVLRKLLVSRFWPISYKRGDKESRRKAAEGLNKSKKPSNGRKDNEDSNPKTALVTQNYRMPESRDLHKVTQNQHRNQKNNVIDTKSGNIHSDTGLPSRINVLNNTKIIENDTESNCIPSLEADEECVETSTCGSNGENDLLSKQNALKKDDVVNVIDSAIDENSMDTEISFNVNVDAILAPPTSVAEVDFLSLSSPFGKEKKKTNHSQKDLSLDNHDSDLEDNVWTIIDVVSDPEDATSSTDDNYLKEIYSILEKEKDKIYKGIPEAAVKRSEQEREESERLEFISTIVKKETIDVPEEVGAKSERDNDSITIKNEKNENPEVNMTETSNDRSNNFLTEDIKSEIIIEDYQLMETEVQVHLPDKNPHQYEVTQINGYPEVKTEIFDEQENSGIRQVDDTIRSANTNEAFDTLNSWKDYNYICFVCRYKTFSFSDLTQHAASEHSIININQLRYGCYDCHEFLNSYSDFLNHVRLKHHFALMLRCDACDKLLKDYKLYELHRDFKCTEKVNYPLIFTCAFCAKAFRSQASRQIHVKHHLDGKQFVCKACPSNFPSKTALKVHETEHKQKKGIFRCSQCPQLYDSEFGLEVHEKKHRDGTLFQCTFCKKCFNAQPYLDKHITSHTMGKKFQCTFCPREFRTLQCNQCEKSFRFRSALSSHLKTHTGIRMYACKYCEKRSNDLSNYKKHLRRKHTLFQCTFCKKCFKDQPNLDKHITSHTQGKKLQCTFCPREFRTKTEQTTHERVHTGEMPLQCNQCEKRFRFRGSLSSHLKTHTGIRMYACKYCEKRFNDLSNYKKHLRRKHGEFPEDIQQQTG